MSNLPRHLRFIRRAPFLLLLITLLGGVLRFTALDQPTIWYDESATFARTAGSYRQMLNALEDAGFGPLHYTIYWWIKNGLPYWGHVERVTGLNDHFDRRPHGRADVGQAKDGVLDFIPTKRLIPGGVTMAPFVMRLIPALCGTLMIPAMYWLTREFRFRRRIALTAALLTAFSAYLLNFSRDAKMYSDLWLMVALNVAALLWWLRTRRLLPWLAWIATGAAMVGLQLQGAMVIAVELLIVLTARDAHHRSFVAFLLSPLVFASQSATRLGRVTIAAVRERPITESDTASAASTSIGRRLGLHIRHWEPWLNIGSCLLCLFAIDAVGKHFAWSKFQVAGVDFLVIFLNYSLQIDIARGKDVRLLRLSPWFITIVALIAILSIVTPLVMKDRWPALPILVIVLFIALLAEAIRIAANAPTTASTFDHLHNGHFHRVWFRNFRMPVLLGYLAGVALIGVGPAVYFASFNQFFQRIETRGFQTAGLMWVPVYNFGRTGPDLAKYSFSAYLTGWEWPRENIYRVRVKDGRSLQGTLRNESGGQVRLTTVIGDAHYDPASRRPGDDDTADFDASAAGKEVVLQADEIASKEPVIDDRDQIDLRTFRAHVAGTIVLAGLILLGAFPWRWPWRHTLPGSSDEMIGSRPPGSDAIRALRLVLWIALPMYGCYCASIAGFVGPWYWIKQLAWQFKQSHWAVKLALPLIALIAFVLCDRTWPRRALRVAQLIGIITVTLLLCVAVRQGYLHTLKGASENWARHGSVWIPRYLGITLPAIFIVISVLIWRLPTRLLRVGVFALFIAVNAGQFVERVRASEPPVDLMVRDALEGRRDNPTQRTFYGANKGAPEPGAAALYTAQSRYYYLISRGNQLTDPEMIRNWTSSLDTELLAPEQNIGRAQQIAEQVARSPATLSRLVVWDRLPRHKVDLTDKTGDALGAAWHRESEQLFTARDHWTWRDMAIFRRRVYVKLEPPPIAVRAVAG